MNVTIDSDSLAMQLSNLVSDECPNLTLRRVCDNDFEDISPGEALALILIQAGAALTDGELDYDMKVITICICNDQPGEPNPIHLEFENGCYAGHGEGGESGTDNPINNALIYLQNIIEPLKERSLTEEAIRMAWFKIFEAVVQTKLVGA